ncbi:MAG: hypothetical protein FDZ75_03730 [Actinobacteria bacterium]|nr:MAG: hypothetical protein FDZ75_03730 [Actinomycetota bacterium]
MSSTVATLAAAPQGSQFPGGGQFQGGPPAGGMMLGGPPGARGGLIGGPLVMMVTTLFVVAMLVVLAVAFWRLFSKTGHSGALALLMLVPFVNLGVMLWFAFSTWPIEKELERLKALIATRPEGML